MLALIDTSHGVEAGWGLAIGRATQEVGDDHAEPLRVAVVQRTDILKIINAFDELLIHDSNATVELAQQDATTPVVLRFYNLSFNAAHSLFWMRRSDA